MESILENVAENILSLKRLLFKKLIDREITASIIPQDAQFILIMLEKKESATMSEIGKELYIPKPNVTPLVDKLVEAKMVERISDSTDRRIVRIKITEIGMDALSKARQLMAVYIQSKLSLLSENDLVSLAGSLNNIKTVMQNIQ